MINSKASGNKTLVFNENLRIGGEDEDHFLWLDAGMSCGLAVAANGHIFIRDIGNTRVLEFDEIGHFIRQIAGKGEGPGEFKQINYWGLLHSGGVGYSQQGGGSKFIFFDKNYKFQKNLSIVMSGYIPRIVKISPTGKWIFARAFKRDPKTNVIFLAAVLLDESLGLVENYWEKPVHFVHTKLFRDPAMLEEYFVHRFRLMWEENTHFVAFGYDGTIFKIDGSVYRIEKRDPDYQEVLMVAEREYEPVPFSIQEKQGFIQFIKDTTFEQSPELRKIVTDDFVSQALEKSGMPLRQNPIQGLIPSDDGHFMVIHKVNHGTGQVSGHYFSPNGQCLANFDYPGQGVFDIFGVRMVLRNGFLYGLEKNEDGDNQLARYSFELK